MKFSTIACLGVQLATAQFDQQPAQWGRWTSWFDCSASCGTGTRQRLRPCLGLTFGGCEGSNVQTGSCINEECPTWSGWSSWGDCSAECNGGTQSRTRTCTTGNDENCPGSATDEQQCNRQSCGRQMIYWDDQISYHRWNYVGAWNFQQCADYCLNTSGCNGVAATTYTRPGTTSTTFACYIHYTPYAYGPVCWGSHCYNPNDRRQTIRFAVFRDYYEAYPQFLPTDEPDGTVGANVEEVQGVCDETSTGFGTVNYQDLEGYSLSTSDDKNVVRESGSNCAARCFEKAGCSAFYAIDNGCTFIIGWAYGPVKTSGVSEAGRINTLCPNNAFTSTYTRRSRFYCLFFAPSDAQDIADNIVQQNIGNTNTPFRVWNFEIESNSPMTSSSQYVSVEMPDTSGSNARYRPVTFTIETHVRVGNDEDNRRRRRSDDEPIPVGDLTLEADEKIHKQAAKDAKKAAKQRQIGLRTSDILADIEAIEQQVTSFILGGEMELPEEIEVAATGPVETVEFVQTAADGSVAADCSSGSCECSAGYIDNGNGCEEMTVEQAATTEAPTTTQAPVDQPTEFLASLIGKLESVFEENRPDKPRNHLLRKWKKMQTKAVNRYNKLQGEGCEFDDTHEDNSVDFDNVDVCNDIESVRAAFISFSAKFGEDCNKVHKGTHNQWHERNIEKIDAVYDRTQNRLGC